MNRKKPPVSVLILALVYIAVGAFNFVYHFRASLASPRSGFWIELTELLAIFCGIYMLRGRNWARWLALAWIAFHVALTAIGSFQRLSVHSVFLVVIAWILFRPPASQFFRGARIEPS